jgi:D-alanyl-D-alanine carboxypeptidase/D-alanyl-D-alanine-endopeptidase (penicillin-binding protein 4)
MSLQLGTPAVGVAVCLALAGGLLRAPPATAAPAEDQPTPPPASQLRIDRLLDRRLDDPRLGRNVGLVVLDASTGAVISARRADRPLQAASNMKLITAVTSLATMGPDQRFPTRVLQGRRPGHVFLRGGGDPLLSRGSLRSLAARTARSLGRGGRVVVHPDTTLFAPRSMAPGWLDRYLGNSVGLVQPLALRGDRGRRPARTAAAAFVSDLRRRGVDARLGEHGRALKGAEVLGRVRGHTVADAVAVMLRVSESSVAEVLFRQVAIAAGRPPTWAGSPAWGSTRAVPASSTGAGCPLTTA